MNLTAKYQPKRAQYWAKIDRFFDTLPPRLFEQSVLLKNNLATFYSDTGQFKDILRREQDLPLLYLHFWLLDDLAGPATPDPADLEQHLFLAMLFTFAAVYTGQTIRDDSSNIDNSYLFLAQALTQQADFHLARLFPGVSPFWEYHHRFWTEYAEAALLAAARQPPNAELTAQKLAFTKIPVAAVAFSLDQETSLPQLSQMMDRLNFGWQILTDLANLRRDLAQRNLTYPLHRAMLAAGIDPHQSVSPERVLGALVLTGTVDQICEECLNNLAAARALAAALTLPAFGRYFELVEARLKEVKALFDLRHKPSPPATASPPFFSFYVNPLPSAVRMAEGYLLADPTFRESWEVQRRGAFGMVEMTAKAFPAGLIVEILARHGHDLSAATDWIFSALQATGYRYFDFAGMPPDADDLGLLLRLFPYSRQQASHREILQTPLGWLRQNVEESGEIPVWLTRQNEFDASTQPFVSLWGQSCVSVETNLLLGLLAYDPTGYRDLIQKSARAILDRWLTQGLSATSHYVPLYSLWLGLELIGRLAASPFQAELQSQLDQTARVITARLEIELKRSTISPQEAAFLTLACLSPGPGPVVKKLFNPRWLTILAKTQRYDGSWAGEPLYGTPTRGELATWYHSRPVTTAFCYHALKIYQATLEAA